MWWQEARGAQGLREGLDAVTAGVGVHPGAGS